MLILLSHTRFNSTLMFDVICRTMLCWLWLYHSKYQKTPAQMKFLFQFVSLHTYTLLGKVPWNNTVMYVEDLVH
uniref:Uncharacterized protein n=1 Tax=Anguilla anguilla TaxID=7936 RepID=A0A0E9XHB4_ANGAN